MTVDAGQPATLRYDEPADLAAVVVGLPRPVLIGLDIDGVLAPIVAHADDSRLLPGMRDVVARLAELAGVTVAAVSGRSLASMRTFDFPDAVRLVGSHGMEDASGLPIELDADEADRLARVTALAESAADRAGDGAWVEHKSASVVLHVRQADDTLAEAALERLAAEVDDVDGASTKWGSAVLELFVRAASKGDAITRLATEIDAVTTVFVGDDVTDEEAFAVLGADDLAIKVGDAPTIARRRLADPPAVLTWLTETARLGGQLRD